MQKSKRQQDRNRLLKIKKNGKYCKWDENKGDLMENINNNKSTNEYNKKTQRNTDHGSGNENGQTF